MDEEKDFTSLDELAQELEEDNEDNELPPPPKKNKKSYSSSPKKETLLESCQKNVKEIVFLSIIIFVAINPWTIQYLMKSVPNISDTLAGTEALEDIKMLNWKGSLIQLGVIVAAFLVFKILNFYEIV